MSKNSFINNDSFVERFGDWAIHQFPSGFKAYRTISGEYKKGTDVLLKGKLDSFTLMATTIEQARLEMAVRTAPKKKPKRYDPKKDENQLRIE